MTKVTRLRIRICPIFHLSINARPFPNELVKLPAHRAGLPGKAISFYIVLLDPAYKAGSRSTFRPNLSRMATKFTLKLRNLNLRLILD
jgi:hypothetical protein